MKKEGFWNITASKHFIFSSKLCDLENWKTLKKSFIERLFYLQISSFHGKKKGKNVCKICECKIGKGVYHYHYGAKWAWPVSYLNDFIYTDAVPSLKFWNFVVRTTKDFMPIQEAEQSIKDVYKMSELQWEALD